MEHTVHHIDQRIRLYNLPAAQAAVGEAFPTDIIESHCTISEFWCIAAICKLYDYRAPRWIDFDGQPATA